MATPVPSAEWPGASAPPQPCPRDAIAASGAAPGGRGGSMVVEDHEWMDGWLDEWIDEWMIND